jgi:hypothetical protein
VIYWEEVNNYFLPVFNMKVFVEHIQLNVDVPDGFYHWKDLQDFVDSLALELACSFDEYIEHKGYVYDIYEPGNKHLADTAAKRIEEYLRVKTRKPSS